MLKTRRVPQVGCTEKERGSFFTPETVQQMGKVYSQATDLQAVQSSGGMPKRHPRGAPWLPVPLIYTLVARGEKTPMRKLIPIRDRVLSITEKEKKMKRKGKRTKGMEEARPFEGMSKVNKNAAGVDIGATEIV